MNRKSLVCILTVALYLGFTAGMAFAQTQAADSSTVTGPPLAVGQTVTPLPDGNLLLVGGFGPDGRPLADIALFDTQRNEQRLQVALNFPRSWHTATVLPDGTVLILGGVGADSLVVGEAEIFDPRFATLQPLTSGAPLPRAFHSATLLTDGRVLIAGGAGRNGKLLETAELWDPRQKTSSSVSLPMNALRRNHVAALLGDGRVRLSGGKDGAGNPSSADELFDPQSQVFSLAPARELSPSNTDITKPTATSPEDGAMDVSLTALLAIRFSRPLQMQSINEQTLQLSGPFGIVDARIVGAEAGMLAFITPNAPLLPATTYTVRFSGAVDAHNASVAFTQFTFTTAGDAPQSDLWVPSADWMIHNGSSKWQSLSPLKAAPGVTALAGQVLKLDGTPLAHVTLQIDARKAESDGTGRFLLTGVPAGHGTMMILADTANTPARKYGVYEVGVDIQPGMTTVLSYTIWMTALDTVHAVRIPSPTTSETVVTSPFLPGLELHLPPNTVITDSRGKVVTEITITPIPLDEPPFPLPHVPVPIYFTIQPGASYIKVVNSTGPKGARLFYPNAHGYPPGTPFQFWNYNAATPKGWFIYGNGKVSQNRAQIIPDPGVELYEFTGAMVSNPGNGPPDGPRPGDPSKDGEPVDLSTGLFVYPKTDLTLPDLISLKLTRTYRQNDPQSRAFGIGTSMPFDMFMVGDNNTFPEGYTFQDLILADGGRIHFQRTSPCTGANGYCDFGNAVYEHMSSGTDFYGAIIRQQGCSPSGFWTLTKKDGTVYCFPDSDASNNPRSAAPTGMRDKYGNSLIFTRDGNHNLTQVSTPNGRWIQFTYDASNRIIQAKDNISRTVSYSYDAAGRLVQVIDANGGVWNYTYDAFSQMTSIQDPRGIFYLTNQYDQNGRVIRQTQADNSIFLFSYTTDPVTGQVTQTDVTDPRGTVRRTVFNANGYKTSFVLAVGQPEQLTITYNRDPNTNLLNSIIDPLGHQTAFTYDSLANITSVTRMAGTPDAVTTSFTYEPAFNQIATFTDSLNHTTTLSYDGLGNLTTVTDPLGHQTSIAHTGSGMPLSITDALGNVTQFSYDGLDLVGFTDPQGNTSTSFVDAAGRIAAITDPMGRKTTYSYNALNEVVQTVDPIHGVTSISYDANGNPVSLTNSLGNSVSWTYDNMDHVAAQTDALLRTESYKYDSAGNLVSATDRKGQVTTYQYDRLNRMTFAGFGTHGSGGGATYDSTVSYQYDGGGRAVQAVDSQSGTITRTYDTLDRLTSEVTPQGSITYGYDAMSRRTSMTVAGQPQVSYSYDEANRLSQILQASSAVNFTYDAAGRRTQVTLPNGINIAYGYDNRSLVTAISYSLGATVLGNMNYAYDALGRRIQVDGSFGRMNLPQPLTSASYDASNELTNWNGVPFSYDANGSMLSDGANTLAWNARNQLATLNGASLQYDAFGRRTKNAAGTSFLYDLVNPVQEQNGATVTANMLTGGIDEIFTRTTSSGAFFMLPDVLGSAAALADSTGTIQTSYTYDPFGNTSLSGLLGINPFQFTGRENEGNGLYFYRARYYSPVLGRFLSEDPIGLMANRGANAYVYADNEPTDLVDPLGLDPVSAPGFLESLIPVWGSGRQAVHDFQCGNWGWGLVNTGLAITDVFLVKSLITDLGKVGVKAGGEAALEWSHWIPDRYDWVPQVIRDSDYNGRYVTAYEHSQMDPYRLLKGQKKWGDQLLPWPERQWNRAPDWAQDAAKLGGTTGAGAAANAGRSCGCN